jgi:hypothetical protein
VKAVIKAKYRAFPIVQPSLMPITIPRSIISMRRLEKIGQINFMSLKIYWKNLMLARIPERGIGILFFESSFIY